MKVSVVIPSFNHCSDLLQPCLESIKQYTDLSDIEIIVVANGCKDNTREYVESMGYPFKLVWLEEPSGYTRSTNEGIKVATGEYVVMLNNDTILQEQVRHTWINRLVEPFETDERMGITGPMKTYCPMAQRDFLIGFCVCTKRELLIRFGLLDEIFAPGYGEDTDYCCKLEDAGYKIHSVCENTSYSGPNRMVGDYPIYHIGNVTFKNWVGGERLLAHNNEILHQRYAKGKPDINKARNCDGYMTDQELRWLGTEAQKRKVIIEIGSWHGRSSRALGDNLVQGGVIYCVDTWNGSKAEQATNHGSAKWKDGDHAFYEFLQNNMDLIQQGKIIPLRMTSKNAADFFREKDIKADMIFIDAGHTYEEARDDIEEWKWLIKDDGIFCGHDYCAWAGVNQAVEEKLSNFFVGAGTTIWYCNKPDIKPERGKVYDCFPFFNELDLLEARFEELWDVVDRFVITEATLTHGGKPKPLYFQDNLKRFEKYLSKVTHIIVDSYPPELETFTKPTDRSWCIERHQRDQLARGLNHCKDNDIIMISDCDEIPSAEAVRNYDIAKGLCAFSQDLFYYQLNCHAKDKWDWARILPYSQMKNMTPCSVRYVPNYDRATQLLHNGGWHFSYLASIEGIIEKIGASAHQEYNRPEWKDPERVKKIVKEGRDLFDRPLQYEIIAITPEAYPKYIYDNLETKFSQYINKD
jgi:beta-1,4-mannosyl-glycoprotein beta-1,4-N-acetylglucosaminyltransferase